MFLRKKSTVVRWKFLILVLGIGNWTMLFSRGHKTKDSVYFDVAKDHRIQSPTERRAQSLVKPRKCLTSSSSQVLECDERSWPRDPKHLFSRVRHAIDHLIVRIFASFRPVHTILFDRLLCDFSFLLTVYLIQICLRFSVGTSFFLHMIRTYITICSS